MVQVIIRVQAEFKSVIMDKYVIGNFLHSDKGTLPESLRFGLFLNKWSPSSDVVSNFLPSLEPTFR